MRIKKSSDANVKSRYWRLELYQDSAKADWIERLRNSGLPSSLILHDRDIWEEDKEVNGVLHKKGDPKKPHWHVVACWDGPTTYTVAKRLADSLGALIPLVSNNIRGSYEYLTHKNDPDKAQYDEKDIQHLNGFVLADYAGFTKTEIKAIKRRLYAIIRKHNFVEYSDLLEYLIDVGMDEELDIADSHTILFQGFLRSRFHRQERALGNVNPATGEVMT